MTLFEVNEIKESYFQEIDYRIKILGLFKYDWEKELIVISQNLNVVAVQYFQVHGSKEVFHNRKIEWMVINIALQKRADAG